MRYRSRGDIIAQILDIANGGATKTKIMFGAYVSYTQLKYYLALLEASELVLFDKSDSNYKTTMKGLVYLKSYQQIDQLIKPTTQYRSNEQLG